MLDACVSMTFPDFQSQMEGAEVILQKCPWKSINEKLGH